MLKPNLRDCARGHHSSLRPPLDYRPQYPRKLPAGKMVAVWPSPKEGWALDSQLSTLDSQLLPPGLPTLPVAAGDRLPRLVHQALVVGQIVQ